MTSHTILTGRVNDIEQGVTAVRAQVTQEIKDFRHQQDALAGEVKTVVACAVAA